MKKTLINNQIRAREVRVVDEAGQQLGVMSLDEALQKAGERNLDLIQVTEKVEPPVCKIIDRGKYLYREKKKEKSAVKKQRGEIKAIRLRFNISEHDLKVRAQQAEKFLKQGDKVRIDMVLRGREKALGEHARKKINQFLETLQGAIPYKAETELKREPRGFSMIIAKQ